jgi:hypothetical protein
LTVTRLGVGGKLLQTVASTNPIESMIEIVRDHAGRVKRWSSGEMVHEADLDDERFDAPEARGLEVLVRGLSMVADDHRVLELSGPLFDGLYEYLRRGLLLGREPV